MIEFDITVTFRGLRKFSTDADNPTQQISRMAGSYMNGADGDNYNNVTGRAWTRVNNDGVIQGTGAPTGSPEEIPNIKKEE